ncbi:MAG: cysteine hydrolase, partial [Betaproteobacteria bacterium]|nr:cysteine hydrolase [Betaproteobacteria bacterium]
GLCATSGLGIASVASRLEPIAKVLDAARRHVRLVLHLVTSSTPGSMGRGSPVVRRAGNRAWVATKGGTHGEHVAALCGSDAWGGKIIDRLQPRPGEPEVIARRWSAFADTSLDLLLRSNGISEVVLLGFTTSGMIETAAREGAARDFNMWILEDCVADFDSNADLHADSLKFLARGLTSVTSSREMLGHAQRQVPVGA